MINKAPQSLHNVYAGERMPCFDLLASGIETGWLPQIPAGLSGDIPSCIPKRLIQFWHSKHIPEEVQKNIESFKAFNPNFTHHMIDDEEARAFIHTHYGQEAASLYDACFHAAMRSDFWRICDLYHNGGVYVDVDTLAHGPITKVGAGADFNCLLTYSIGKPWCIDNDFFMTEARHPLLHAILGGLFENVDRFVKTKIFENIWVETGPGVTTIKTAGWLAHKALDAGVSPKETGVIFRHHHALGEAFYHAEMQYKNSVEGNWRIATPS
ncbi:glycosyltransferase family 32 protein [Neokomagataea thailandica]|nr:glycosyltransferase [Neokomagataea thailandica]